MPHTAKSFCPLDCPDACSLEVQIDQGRVVSVEGDHRNPVTQGFICNKVRHLPEHLYGEHRLLFPLIRQGAKGAPLGEEGTFRRASWEEALTLITDRLSAVREQQGGEAILPLCYGGSNGMLSQDTTDARLFRRLGASRLGRTVCAETSSRAVRGMYGRIPSVAPQDYADSKLIVIWGSNPSASGIHQVPYIRQAVENGAKLVVVDPRAIPLARQADLHIALRPGTDLPLALAVVRRLFETGGADLDFLREHATGVDELRERAEPWTLERTAEVAQVEPTQIAQLADLWAEISPAIVRCGYGPERNRNGGSATAAILSLPAVGGKFGVRGGGYTMSNAATFDLDTDRAIGAAEVPTREINMNRIGRALLSEAPYDDGPPISALVVYNHNPAMTLPDQKRVLRGLAREELFTVVLEPVRTDTCRWADVILPTATLLEQPELHRGYGTMILQEADAIAEPPGESRTNHEIFAELVERLGLGQPEDSQEFSAFRDAALACTDRAEELAASLEKTGTAFPATGFRGRLYENYVPKTSDGKIHLFSAELDSETPNGLYFFQEDPASERYPLALISPATSKTISSTFGERHRELEALQMHARDAEARGLQDGQGVRVFNELGDVLCPVRLSKRLRPGVVFLPKGLWSHNTRNGATGNSLVPDTLSDLAGGACFNDARVQVEAAPVGEAPRSN